MITQGIERSPIERDHRSGDLRARLQRGDDRAQRTLRLKRGIALEVNDEARRRGLRQRGGQRAPRSGGNGAVGHHRITPDRAGMIGDFVIISSDRQRNARARADRGAGHGDGAMEQGAPGDQAQRLARQAG